jgi:serine protease Do
MTTRPFSCVRACSTLLTSLFLVWGLAAFSLDSPAAAGPAAGQAALERTSAEIQALVEQARRSVVQVAVTGYRPASDDSGGGVLVRSRGIGSGVVVDSRGYIITNAHVIAGAEHVDVILSDQDDDEPLLGTPRGRTVPATLLGVAPELDLALLAVDVAGLPALKFADSGAVRQGEMVFALGSPAGLRNSVSMGVVSAVARQAQPDNPIAYIQTDTAINPGNSGGPLLNIKGELLGLNTFIQTMSGGNEGLGFALPASVIALAYPQLRDFGHLHRATTGMALEALTPLLRDGLGLTRESGFIVADLAADGPAAQAGVHVGDVIAAIDGRAVESLSFGDLYRYLYAAQDGQKLALEIERGAEHVHIGLNAVLAAHTCERPHLVDTPHELVDELGIFAETMPASDDDKSGEGVVVTNRVQTTKPEDVPLERGDVIRAVNGAAITSMEQLHDALSAIKLGAAVVLQVYREGQLTYLAFSK